MSQHRHELSSLKPSWWAAAQCGRVSVPIQLRQDSAHRQQYLVKITEQLNYPMSNKSIYLIGLGILSTWLYPHQSLAQTPIGINKNNPTTYEDDKIRVVIQDCSRKQQETICQAILTSKNSDRAIDLNGSNIKLIDIEGNEYYPTSLRLANRLSENNGIKTELVENVPFKASFVFGKMPSTMTKIALLQIPIGGSLTATAKFRNLIVVDGNPPKTDRITKIAPKPNRISPEVSSDYSLICPDRTNILYRATSKHYLMYICGLKTPTHYVGHSQDGSEGITLRLRYFDRTRFSADNGDTNYTIARNKLIISKDNKVIYQEKIEVLQPLPGTVIVEETPPTKVKVKKVTPTAQTVIPKRKSKAVTTTPVSNSNKRKSTLPLTPTKGKTGDGD